MTRLSVGRPGSRFASWLVVALCAIALSVCPLLQHDPECHARPLRHRGACMASPLALSSDAGVAVQPFELRDAGRVELARPPAPETAFAVEAPGRSPPA